MFVALFLSTLPAAHAGLLRSSVLQAPNFDGWLRTGCGKDASPASERYSFKDHACKGAQSCLLKTRPMEPEVCFNFCRYTDKGFFVIQGNDCYCTTYFTLNTIADGCPWVCEGDQTQRCGGPDASSLFAMHHCGDSATEAQMVLELATKGQDALSSATGKLEASMHGLRNMAKSWNFECGSRQDVCNYDDFWWKSSDVLMEYSRSQENTRQGAARGVETLKQASENLTDETYAQLEQATEEAKRTGKLSQIAAEAAIDEIKKQTRELQKLGAPVNATLFEEVGDVEDNWHSICDLEVLRHFEGMKWAALEDAKPVAPPAVEVAPMVAPAPVEPAQIDDLKASVDEVAPLEDDTYVKNSDQGYEEGDADWGDEDGGDDGWQAFEEGDEFDDEWLLHHSNKLPKGHKPLKKNLRDQKIKQHSASFLAKRHHRRRLQKHKLRKDAPALLLQAQTWCLNNRDCVAFNIQEHPDGAFGVQFLRNKGLTQPQVNRAIPVFKISQTKIQDLGFERVGCFALRSFMMDNGYGPTGTDVYKEVILRPGDNSRDTV